MEHPIVKAVWNGAIDEVRGLLVEHPEWLRFCLIDGGYSLLGVARTFEMTKLLLENGIDVNHRDDEGRTILLSDLLMKDNKFVLLYLRHGADPYVRDNEGDTARDYILCTWGTNNTRKQWEWIQSVQFLIWLMASSNRKKQKGKLALTTDMFRYLHSFLFNTTQ